jgi:multicomponent Na+:H+ antiporter subunit G
MTVLITFILIIIGATLMFPAALGIVRLPDIYMRISAATKAATLGAGCLLLAVAVHFRDPGVTGRAIAVIIFIFLTSPVGAHMLGRAAYLNGAPLWYKTRVDDLKDQYDPHTHALAGKPASSSHGSSLLPEVKNGGD